MARRDRRTEARSSEDKRAAGPQTSPALQRRPKNTLDCLRHDARSAAHTLHGFIELLTSAALGTLNEEQLRALSHLQMAAARMTELVETSLDLALEKKRVQRHELSCSRLSPLTHKVVSGLQREQPNLQISLELLPEAQEAPSEVEPIAFTKVVRTLVELMSDNNPAALSLRVSQTDLHTSLVISARAESRTPRNVPQSVMQPAASADLESMAHDWKNRDYLRLKHCQLLLNRQRGRLLVTADLTRVRLMLPLQRLKPPSVVG